ncbi:MAG: TonB-dependent receptor [Saprospiraceae bacterium]|nr:TonB-dependent receptor [Saprospiraceae bacterium]
MAGINNMIAQDDSTALVLDPIVVTGTRIQQQKSKVPASITIVNRSVLERSGESNILPLLNSQIPGFFLNARNPVGYGVGPESGGNISLRGVSGSPNTQVLILIDGQPQFMGIFGHPIADAYTASDVERVEVLRGAASLLYGSNAMGGAINIITRDVKKDGLHGQARASIGSFNTQILSGHVGFKKDEFKLFAAANREQSDGFRKDANDEFSNTTAFIKANYQVNEQFSLSADANIADATYYHPGFTSMPLQIDGRSYLRGRASISLDNAFEKVSGALRAFYNYGNHDFDTGFKSNDFNRGITFYQNIHFFDRSILTLGVDYKEFGGMGENNEIPPPARIGLNIDHTIKETEGYAILQHGFSESFSINAGWRFVDNSIYGSNTVPGVGLAYEISDQGVFKANASKAFRSPTVNDLFFFAPANQDLQPEELWNYEVSFGQHLAQNRLRLEVTAFLMEGENLVQVVPTGNPGPPQRRNTGEFNNKGIELQVSFTANDHVDIMANYSYLDASTSVLFAPTHQLNFQTNYKQDKWQFQTGFQLINGLRTSLDPDISLENYLLLDAKTSYDLLRNLKLFIEVNNLLDVTYVTQSGFPMPGASVLGGVSVHF